MADIQSGFEKYLSILRNHLSYVEDNSFSWDDVIGMLIIQLKNTDSLNKERKESHATQIQLTSERGTESGTSKTEDFFPTFTLNSTFKSWRISIPTRLNTTNIQELSGNTIITRKEHTWINDTIQIRRRILNADDDGKGNPTLQICYGDDLMPLRENLNVKDYLVIVKRKSEPLYEVFGVKSSVDLGIGKNMYRSPKANSDTTVFSLPSIIADEGETIKAFSNEYQRAAEFTREYSLENGIDVSSSDEELNRTYEQFQQKFPPEKLKAISDEEILKSLFYSSAKTNDSLCYWLEKDKDCREYMGGISGGFAYVFGLFQKSDTGKWMSGSSAKPEELTEEQAVVKAKEIRDAIVAGADIIKEALLENLDDYEKLDEDLSDAMGQWAYRGWIHKYFSMLYPEKLSGFHSTDWQKHILYALRIMPSEKYYARSGQIAMVQNYNNWVYYNLSLVTREAFGRVLRFLRLGCTDGNKSYADEWRKRGIVGIGWKNIGSLDEFVTDKLERSALADKLTEKYYPNDTRTASKKAGEIQSFYNSDENSVFAVMNGQTPIALVDEIGEYTYNPSSDMAHIKKGKWHNSFDSNDSLPFKSVGKLTTCYEITDQENLIYLYEKYYYALDSGKEAEPSDNLSEAENRERFRQWMLNKSASSDSLDNYQQYSDKTVMVYVNWLNRIKIQSGESIFGTRDISIVDPFIENVPDVFPDTNKDQIPAAIKKYKEYLLDDKKGDEVMNTLKNCLEINRNPRQDKLYPLNVIIYGAPGTGKTYSTAEYALRICGKDVPTDRKEVMEAYNSLIHEGRVVFTTFHQSYGYEEFIQGLRPDTTSEKMNFKVVDGVFKKIADRALNDLENNYVIIIDEINRANISKVFGELITLIEEDKRWGELNELCATLQSGDVFAVPNNLYIVGTMNSADKSISLIDTALRRRFEFVEQKPDPELISDPNLKTVLKKMNTKLADDLDSSDLLIGHSYFMNKKTEELPSILNNSIIPLLYEYFYDDKKKVGTVLDYTIDGLQVEIVDDKMGRLSVKKKDE